MPKAAAIHPSEIDDPSAPPVEPDVPLTPPLEPVDVKASPDQGRLDLEEKKQALCDVVLSYPLASLGVTVALGGAIGILLKRLR